MLDTKQIKVLFAAALLVLLGTSFSYSQQAGDVQSYTKIDHKISIGFQLGGSFLFNLNVPHRTTHKAQYHNYCKLYAQLPVTNNVKIEVGLNYKGIKTFGDNALRINKFAAPVSRYDVSIPVTLQYHFAKKNRRIKPYVGAGIEYNPFYTRQNKPDFKTDNLMPYMGTGTQYVSLVFVEGVVYEINTKIQVIQLLHFFPNGGIKTLGLDLGIGFKIP